MFTVWLTTANMLAQNSEWTAISSLRTRNMADGRLL